MHIYKAVHTKTDKAEDIGPNIVQVGVFVITGGGEEGTDGGKRGGVGVTATLTDVSEAVWGSFGYQGAAGAHSVVFRS